MKAPFTSILTSGVIAFTSLFAVSSTHAVLTSSFNATASTGNFSFLDTLGNRTLIGRNATVGASVAQVRGPATTTLTRFTGPNSAFSASATNVGFSMAPLALQTYTFEIWTRLGGGVTPTVDSVLFESGGGGNGFGIFTRADGSMQFATYSGSGTNNNLISLSLASLNKTDFLQLAAVYNTTTNLITLQIKDVNGVSVSGTDSSGALVTGTSNAAGLFISGLDTGSGSVSTSWGNAGGSTALTSPPGSANAYTGQVALFNIYNNDAIANGDVLASFNAVVIPEPSSALLLGAGVAGLVLLHRRRGIVRG